MSTPKYDSLEIDGLKYKTQLTDKFIHRKQWEKPDPGAVITYIPGSIIDLYVKEGQEVKAGDLLCLLEAMKMHNKIQAPISGTVTKIHVNKGDKLPKDALMPAKTEADIAANPLQFIVGTVFRFIPL